MITMKKDLSLPRLGEEIVTYNGLTGTVVDTGIDDAGQFLAVKLNKDAQVYKYDPWEIKPKKRRRLPSVPK